jgi:predicted amidophosphoribosyltransferase
MNYHRTPGLLTYCGICNAAARTDDLCEFCQSELEELGNLGTIQGRCGHLSDIHAVYQYDAAVRRLIHLAKIQGDLRALRLIEHLIRTSTTLRNIGPWADAVMPAPSSLWSRVRGRLDLAYLVASICSVNLNIPLWPPPVHLQYRWAKSSFRSKHERQPITPTRWRVTHHRQNDQPVEHLLLVDDVYTSGLTLRNLACDIKAAFPETMIRGLVLACANDA